MHHLRCSDFAEWRFPINGVQLTGFSGAGFGGAVFLFSASRSD
jgi:hypothetical protein